MIINIILCIIGFLMLYFGAEYLVKGSSSLAKSLGVTPIVIGLTVVAFGTSAPEFVVSLVSSIKGQSMIAVGNVIGSNICNMALVLGISSIFQPIKSDKGVIKRDIPVMLGISVYLLFISLDSSLSRLEGVTLFLGIIIYTLFNYYRSRKVPIEEGLYSIIKEQESLEFIRQIEELEYVPSRAKQAIMIILGIVGVVVGARFVVDSAVKIMEVLGVSQKFIGLTIVAFGTSLPELATSVVAAIRKEMDISIGNLVGSNVFNILSVLGAAAIVRPIPIPGGFFKSGLIIDYLVMMLTSSMPLFLMRKDYTLTRKGGSVLLTIYSFYLIYLILKG